MLPLPGLNRGDQSLTTGHITADLVQFLAVAFFNQLALPNDKGRVFVNGLVNQLGHVLHTVNLTVQLAQQGGFAGRQNPLEPRQLLQGRADGPQVPAIGGAVYNLRHQPLQILNTGQLSGQGIQQGLVFHQLLHRVQPQGDFGGAHQRALQPGADQPLAHRSFGPVQHPKQGALALLVPHGLNEFQIPYRVQIQRHVGVFRFQLQLGHALQAGNLGPGQIIQQSPNGQHSQRLVPQLQFRQTLPAELPANRLLSRCNAVFFLFQTLHCGVQPVPDKIPQTG